MSGGQQLHRAHGEGRAGAPGDGEQRADGEIQQGAEEQAVPLGHPPGQLHHALAAAQAQSYHRQHGDAHGGDEDPKKGAPDVQARIDAQLCREDQVARAEEHTKEHTGDGHGFLGGETAFHGNNPFHKCYWYRIGFLGFPQGEGSFLKRN